MAAKKAVPKKAPAKGKEKALSGKDKFMAMIAAKKKKGKK